MPAKQILLCTVDRGKGRNDFYYLNIGEDGKMLVEFVSEFENPEKPPCSAFVPEAGWETTIVNGHSLRELISKRIAEVR